MLLALAGAALLAACEQETGTSATAATAPAAGGHGDQRAADRSNPGFGFTDAWLRIDQVQLRARVTGFLEQRRFEEGADVDAGELLFVIEKARYQAMVEQRQAEPRERPGEPANTGAAAAR